MELPAVVPPHKSDIWGLSDGEGCEWFWSELWKLIPNLHVTGVSLFYIQSMKVSGHVQADPDGSPLDN